MSSYGLYESKGIISKSQLKKVIQTYEKGEKGNFLKLIELIKNREIKKLNEELQINQPLINSLVGELKNKGLMAEVTNSPTKIVLTEKGKKYITDIGTNDEILEILRNLANSDLSWIEVKNIQKIENDSDYVYDLTVEDNHNFIANGIIVHNTTTAGKLAKFYKKRGKKVAVIQTDTWRPAAFQQLQQLAKQNDVQFYGTLGEKDPSKIFKTYENELNKFDIVIIDTAGRDALSEDLVEELNQINKTVNAHEKLLVISADVGQGAKKQAEFFHQTCGVTGVIITKLDGSAKGGGALTACSVTNAKVKFIGIGEKVDDFEIFSPERFVSRLLGMGDLQSLLEKAKDAISEDEAQDLGAKLLKGEFNLLDMYNQMEAMSKMGPLGKVMEMIPGMSKMQLPKEMLASSEEDMKKWKFIMNSMTKEELEDPEIITSDRMDRIALGCGQDISHVRKLLKQFKQSKKMIKMFKGGGNKKMNQMMKQLGGMDTRQLGM